VEGRRTGGAEMIAESRVSTRREIRYEQHLAEDRRRDCSFHTLATLAYRAATARHAGEFGNTASPSSRSGVEILAHGRPDGLGLHAGAPWTTAHAPWAGDRAVLRFVGLSTTISPPVRRFRRIRASLPEESPTR
jgi:hypothetical protein